MSIHEKELRKRLVDYGKEYPGIGNIPTIRKFYQIVRDCHKSPDHIQRSDIQNLIRLMNDFLNDSNILWPDPDFKSFMDNFHQGCASYIAGNKSRVIRRKTVILLPFYFADIENQSEYFFSSSLLKKQPQ